MGERLDAKFDGKLYQIEDDPAHTMVSVKLINPYTVEQTNVRDGKVVFVAPFLAWSKREVYEYFIRTGIDLSLTYSCEAGTEPPCGQCASCRDRKTLGC